jgi:amino acid transporter
MQSPNVLTFAVLAAVAAFLVVAVLWLVRSFRCHRHHTPSFVVRSAVTHCVATYLLAVATGVAYRLDSGSFDLPRDIVIFAVAPFVFAFLVLFAVVAVFGSFSPLNVGAILLIAGYALLFFVTYTLVGRYARKRPNQAMQRTTGRSDAYFR